MGTNCINTRNNHKMIRGDKFGIRSQLVFLFTFFVILVLIIIWVFQVLLLDYFYEKTKMSHLQTVHEAIDQGIQSGNLDEISGELAAKYDVCISVYRIIDGELGDILINKEVNPTCFIHYADPESLNTYYQNALAHGGEYRQRFYLPKKDRLPNKDHGKSREAQIENINLTGQENDFLVVALSTKVLSDGAGEQYVAFINLSFTPVNAVQNTMNVQFAYIALIVIVSSIIFSCILSSKIARPLERMTCSAEHVAQADYSTKFSVEGYREIRHLAQTLNYAVDEISKTDKFQKELISNISHDLRTPLALITGYAEIIRDIPGENSVDNIQLIIEESNRLTNLVNDMLDISKYSAGVDLPKMQMFNLTDSIKRVITRYNHLIKSQGYNISFDFTEEVRAYADERMILQVLYNLINNAVNYTGEDKIVRIIQTKCSDGTVKIEIVDTGNGIAKEDLEYIWDRYYKIDKTHQRAVVGSGLGLSIVSKILQLHSASYGVESSNNKGSVFWFKLKICL